MQPQSNRGANCISLCDALAGYFTLGSKPNVRTQDAMMPGIAETPRKSNQFKCECNFRFVGDATIKRRFVGIQKKLDN
jgi:hypothetical protein